MGTKRDDQLPSLNGKRPFERRKGLLLPKGYIHSGASNGLLGNTARVDCGSVPRREGEVKFAVRFDC